MPSRNPYVGFEKDRRRVHNLWERFNSGEVDAEGLRDPYSRLLVDEWQRCARDGVDPTRRVGVKCAEQEYQRRLEDSRHLIGVARPHIDAAVDLLGDVRGIVLLADCDGVILYIDGNNVVRRLADDRSGVVEGSRWQEAVAGTNGMGSALLKRESVHVYSTEHFCEGWHNWSCAATPLLDPDYGDPIGVIDFTTVECDYRGQALNITASLARSISGQIGAEISAGRQQLVRRYETLCSRYRAEHLILVDDRGRLIRSGRGRDQGFKLNADTLRLCADAIPIRNDGDRQLGTAYILDSDLAQLTGSVRRTSRKATPRPRSKVEPSLPGAAGPRGETPPDGGNKKGEHEHLLGASADYQVIFDNAIVGICYSIDRVIMRCNRRFEQMFGYEPGELDNKEFLQIYPSESDYLRIGRSVYRHFHTHRIYTDERLMRCKNGRLFWCAVSGKRLDPPGQPPRTAIWILQDVSRRKDAEEALQRTHQRLEALVQERTSEVRKKNEALKQEIARRKRIEEKLRESQKKYRVLFETSPVGMLVTDMKGDVVEVNKAMARMIPKSELSASIKGSKNARVSMIHPDGTVMRRNDLADARALRENRTIPEFEVGMRTAEGAVRWFNVTSAPIPVKSFGAVVAHRETTETKRLEEQERIKRLELARASRVNTMGEMAAAMAHELGQPLSSVVNFLSGCRLRLEAGDYDREAVYDTLSQALYYAEHAGDIIKHIRQFVRCHEPNKVMCDLNAVIREVLRFMDIERRQVGATIELQLSTLLPPLMLDPLEIKQLMVNLIKNGLEAMAAVPEAGRILSISSRTRGRKWVEVAVTDRGSGVSSIDAKNIFNPFFSTKNNGLGLGLVICRSIVESHGGKITVGGNAYRGATFSFCLPQAATDHDQR